MTNTYVEKSVQLVRGSSFRNDLLQNPYFKNQNLFETLEEADNIASTRNPWVKKCKRTHIEN